MSESHNATRKPSPLLALIALAIVHRFRPAWCALTLADAALAENVRVERLSRLCTRAISGFEAVVARLIAIGRPAHDREAEAVTAELAITKSLLAVSTAVLRATSPWRRPPAREIVVSAWLRLQAAHPGLTQAAFTSAIALSTRTLRWWLARKATAPPNATSAPEKKSKRKRGPRQPRFTFEFHVPGLQFGEDTTDFEVFGVRLKLIGLQDIGGRDQSLLDSVIVDDHESSDLVVETFTSTLRALAGAQFLTDQGTPYMAQKTREALAELEIEHAPQKEGDPPGKATLERAFGLLKPILAPIIGITSRLASAVPQLGDKELAKATAQLLLTALLRAYQAGARATRRALASREKHTEESLGRLAARAREQARADDRSARLLLGHVHDIYIRQDLADVPVQRSRKRFVDSLRRYPVEVLQDAERRFRAQVHRHDIRDRAAYFARLVRDGYDAFKKRRERQRDDAEQEERRELELARVREADAALAGDPVAWLRRGLELVAMQWNAAKQTLIADGAGLGAAYLRGAIATLVARHGPITTTDIAWTVLRDFSAAHQRDLGSAGIAAVQQLLERMLPRAPTYDATTDFAGLRALDILIRAGKTGHHQPFDLLSS